MGSDNGGKAAAILYSMMASAKANQVEPFAYVRDLLVQLSRYSPPAVAALLPNTWLTGHPESRRAGRGSWVDGGGDTEKLIFDDYSAL
jgi:transposase